MSGYADQNDCNTHSREQQIAKAENNCLWLKLVMLEVKMSKGAKIQPIFTPNGNEKLKMKCKDAEGNKVKEEIMFFSDGNALELFLSTIL